METRIFGAPLRYVQGPGAIEHLAREVEIAGGGHTALIVDPVAHDQIGSQLKARLPDALILRFGGECTHREIADLADKARNAALIVGIGGGKAIDTAKGVAIKGSMPVGIVPTIASNDSPTSHIAVVYTEDHAVDEVIRMRTNPHFVLVDTAVIARAPRRFLAAGIGDAMSKKYELAGAFAGQGRNFFGGSPTELTQAISARAHDILIRDGRAAMAADLSNAAFERVVEATILLSGLAFESGGLSIAHSMVRGFSVMPQLAGLLHGELVALGTLTQLAAGQGDSAEVDRLVGFFDDVGLPTDFTRFGLNAEADFLRIAEVSLTAPYATNYFRPLSARDLAESMISLNHGRPR